MKAKLYYTLSSKYSIAKLRSFDNGANSISINFMDCFWYLQSKKGAVILSIFSEVKEYLTARQVDGIVQMQEAELSEDMMAFAFAMGE